MSPTRRFMGLSDFELVLMINETKKAGHPEDKAFIKEVQMELSRRAKERRGSSAKKTV